MDQLRTLRAGSCLAAAAGLAVGQQWAAEEVPQGFAPLAAIPIDLDGDGDEDFGILEANGQGLTPFFRVGPARFRRGVVVATPSGLVAGDGRPAVGDVDGDGDADVVLVDGMGNVVVLRNAAGSLLASMGAQVALGAPRLWRLLDADGDGDPDLFTATDAGNALSWNDGSGAFVPATAPPGLPLEGAEVADVDRDGRMDLVGFTQGALTLWRGGAGGLVDESASRLPVVPGSAVSVGVADLDADGDIDLFGGRSQAVPAAFFLRNDGSGRFVDASTGIGGTPLGGGPALAFDDDADGDLDMVVGRNLLRGDGAGTFVFERMLPWQLLRGCDVDGDRHGDYVAGIVVWRNLAGRAHGQLIRCDAVQVGDVDRDVDVDVLGHLSVWRTNGSGRAATPALPNPAQPGTFGDLDGDGAADYLERAGGMVRIWHNDGSGFFAPAGSFLALSIDGAPHLVDADGDADLDVLTTHRVGNWPMLLRNDGNLQFADTTVAAFGGLPPLPRLLSHADVDADGDVDLLLSDGVRSQVAANRGDGTYALGELLPFGVAEVTAAQLDPDAALELLVVRAGVLSLWDRTATGWTEVTSQRLPGSAGATTGPLALDFDVDGDADLLLRGAGRLLANDGRGTFVDVTATRGPLPTSAFTAADLDGDGDPEVLDGRSVWINRQRQLELTATPRAGGRLAVEFVGEAGFGTGAVVGLVTLAVQRSARGIPMLGGRFFPDAATSTFWTTVVSAGGQPVSTSTAIPNLPTLVGLPLHLQGLAIGSSGELGLLNHIATAID